NRKTRLNIVGWVPFVARCRGQMPWPDAMTWLNPITIAQMLRANLGKESLATREIPGLTLS
ncbi:MAG: hypothetical protein ACO4AI_08000, partial [Prochlorothrix sp.]